MASQVCAQLIIDICDWRSDYRVGMRVHRKGNARPLRLRLAHRRCRTNWKRPPVFDERCDSPAVAKIFSRAPECLGFAVSFAARFFQVCLMKLRRFLLRAALFVQREM